jgi:phosphoglycerol transferase MdoB-like AlkP superfamily enzyme
MDSLATQSLIFPNTFANGRQSIHGMSSVLAGIPSLTDAFTESPYSNQKIQSIVSVCNDLGYDTSFIMEPRMDRWDSLDLEIF